MKRALVLAFLSMAVACGKGSAGNAGDGGSDGSTGGSGGGSWGCLNTGSSSCICQTNPPPGQYPDQSCTGAQTCCYTTPPQGGASETQCACIPAPSAQCAGIVSGTPGAQLVSNCPPGATSGSTGTNASGSGSGGTSGSTAWACANETDSCVCKTGASPTDYPLSSCAPAACCYTASFRGTTQCFCSNQLPADRCSDAIANSPGAAQVDACPPPASTSGSGSTGTSATTATTSTNGSVSNGGSLGGSGGSNGGSGGSAGTNASGGTSASAGTNASGGSLGGSAGSAGGSGGSNGSVGGSSASIGGSGGSGGTSAGTNASGSGSGTSASSGTNSSAGTTGSTATNSGGVDFGSGTADVSGSQAFLPAGAFEETGYDRAHNVPTLNFLIFDAPMTCFMFETHYFPNYYGHLPDGRLVYADYPDAGGLYYPNYQGVLYDRPDGGDRYYYLPNGNTQDYSGSLPVTAFPKTAHVVLGIIDSPNSQPVPLGSYPAYNDNYVGVGYVALDDHADAGIIDTISSAGTVNFTSHTSSRLVGDFNIRLESLGLNSGIGDAGLVFYPDGGFDVPDGGLDTVLGAVDAGYLSGHFNAVQCSF